MKRYRLSILFIIFTLLPTLLLGYAFRTAFVIKKDKEIEIKDLFLKDGQLEIFLEGEDIPVDIDAYLSPLLSEDAGLLVRTWGKIVDVKISQGLAFLANDKRGLHLVQIDSTASPKIISTVQTPGKAWSLELRDNYCFVADGLGLQVIDFRNPTAPKQIGSFPTEGYALGLSVAENLLVLCDGKEGILLFDIRVPEDPRLLSKLDTPGYAFDAKLVGETVYVADGPSGIQAVDISNPEMPQIVESITAGTRANFITTTEDYLFFGGSGQTLHVYNKKIKAFRNDINLPAKPFSAHVKGRELYVSHWGGVGVFSLDDPDGPEFIATFPVSGISFSSDVYEDLLFVANGNGGLRILPFKEPYGLEDRDRLSKHDSPLSIIYAEEHLFVSSYTGIDTFHWEEEKAPDKDLSINTSFLGDAVFAGEGISVLSDQQNVLHFVKADGSLNHAEFAQCRVPGRLDYLKIWGDEVFIVLDDIVYRIDLALSPELSSRPFLKAPGQIIGFDIRGNKMSIVTDCGHFASIDLVSSRNSISFISLPIEGKTTEAVLFGKMIYLNCANGEILVIDSDLQKVVSRVFPLEFPASRLLLNGKFLCVQTRQGTIDVFDTSTPEHLQKVYSLKGFLLGLSDKFLFIFSYDNIVSMIDLTDDVSQIVNRLKLDHQPRSFAVDGDTFCFIDYGFDFRMYDIGPPLSQHNIKMIGELGSICDMVSKDSFCYLARHENGISLVDISAPDNPEICYDYFVSCDVQRLKIARDFLFALDTHGKVNVFDVSDQPEMTLLAEVRTGGTARDVALKDDILYVADGKKGLQLVDLVTWSELQLIEYNYLPWPASVFHSMERVEVFGDYLFALYNQGGFQVFDIRDLRKPVPIAFLNLPGYLVDMELSGCFVFVFGSEGTFAIDVKEPEKPFLVDTFPALERVKNVASQDNTIFAASPLTGIQRYFVPTLPKEYRAFSKNNISISFEPARASGRYRLSIFDASKERIYAETLDLKDVKTIKGVQ